MSSILSKNEFVASMTAIIMCLSTILNEFQQDEAYLSTISTSDTSQLNIISRLLSLPEYHFAHKKPIPNHTEI